MYNSNMVCIYISSFFNINTNVMRRNLFREDEQLLLTNLISLEQKFLWNCNIIERR